MKHKVLEVHIHLLIESGRYYIQVWSYIHRHLYVGGEVSSSVGGVLVKFCRINCLQLDGNTCTSLYCTCDVYLTNDLLSVLSPSLEQGVRNGFTT